MRVTVYPQKFQREPVDLGAFDRWQDWEGLVDASDGCREAWQDWREGWRAARKLDLGRSGGSGASGGPGMPANPSTLPAGRFFAGVRHVGSQVRGKRPGDALEAWEAQAALSLKRRVVSAGHWDIWHAITDMAFGRPLDVAAARQGVEARVLRAAVRLVALWHAQEMVTAAGFWGDIQPD